MAGGPAPTTLLHRLIAELEQDRPARWPVDEVRELRLYRDDITLAELPAPQVCSNPSDLQAATALCIDAPGSYRIGSWLGLLLVEPADAGANGVVALASLAHLQARPRHGGEHFQRAVNMPARSLKKQYQAAGVPAWQRHGPLLWSDGRLLFAPGLGVDAWWHLRHGDSIAGSCCRLFWIARNSHSDADVNEQLAP
jgi:tRNA(Ile)-lysidine synthase